MARLTAAAATLAVTVAALAAPLRAQQPPPPRLTVRVSAEGRPLEGAEVRSEGKLAISDASGAATLSLSAGSHRVRVWRIGYAVDTLAVTLPAAGDTSVSVTLAPLAVELAPIVVRATRVETLLEEQPERVEVLAPEDVNEKSLTRPGDMTNLLVEMGGVRVQPEAPGLGGASIRVQGLPGRYTLLLTDGLPLQGGHAPAFSLVQAPPLDLRQVEVIKGAATALYGPSALGGVVDLVSRPPDSTREVVLSQTTEGGSDALAWLSRRTSPRWGYTLLAGAHRQGRRDLGSDGWTDLPGYRRVEARPRLFWNGPGGGSLLLTAGGTWERREGGTVPGAVVPSGVPFPEDLRTRHGDVGVVGHVPAGRGLDVGVRASAMATGYDHTLGDWSEADRRSTLFGEATLGVTRARHEAVAGVAAQRDGFRTRPRATFDHAFTTLSLFGADTYTPVAALSLAASARLDHHSRYGTFVSPRASLLWRLGGRWSVRAAAARGFLAATVASGETEEVGFSRLVEGPALQAEKGESASLDVDGGVGPLQLNATLFGVRVHHPVLPHRLPGDGTRFELVNAAGPLRSVGAELFAVYAREPFLVTASYSRTVASELSPDEGARVEVPLTPRNAGGVDAAWEEDEPGESGFRAAVEVFYTGRQRVEDDPYRTLTPAFTTVEVLVSKRFGRVTVFANGDNLTDVRQTGWDSLILPRPGIGGRWTTDEWAPLEGRVFNVGVRATF